MFSGAQSAARRSGNTVNGRFPTSKHNFRKVYGLICSKLPNENNIKNGVQRNVLRPCNEAFVMETGHFIP